MSIFNNLNIIFNEIKSTYKLRFQESLKMLNAFLIVLGIRFIIMGLSNLFINDEYSIQYILFYFSTSLLMMGLEIGMIKFYFKFIDNKIKSQFEIFNYFYLLKKYFSGLLFFYLIIAISLIPGLIYLIIKTNYEILNIIQNSIDDVYFQQLVSSYFTPFDVIVITSLILIPIIYIMTRLCFWNYLLIDQDISGLEAIIQSFKITKYRELEIILYFGIFIILNLFGILTIFGMLFTIPTTYLFFAKYSRLLKSGI